MLNYLIAALLLLVFGAFLFKNSIAAQSPFNFEKPDRTISLPIELKEISGLSLTSKPGQLVAIGDEKGQLFFINLENGAIERSPVFREKGDFEDLAVVKDSVWAVKSDGKLFRLKNIGTDKPTFEEFEPGFLDKDRDDVEGLCFDEKNDRLLLACKGKTDSFLVRRFFQFNLTSEEFLPNPVFSLDPCDVEKLLPVQKKSKPFSPSGIAIQPKTGDIFVLSSVGKMLAILDSTGVLKQAIKLDKDLLPQPEGIAFGADGTLYLSSEGKQGEGVILVFKPKK